MRYEKNFVDQPIIINPNQCSTVTDKYLFITQNKYANAISSSALLISNINAHK